MRVRSRVRVRARVRARVRVRVRASVGLSGDERARDVEVAAVAVHRYGVLAA